MSLKLYFDLLHAALSSYNVDLLVKIWHDSHYLGEIGIVLRTAITSALSALSQHFDIDAGEDVTFKDFVSIHDDERYLELCDDSPDNCLLYFLERRDWRNVKIALQHGAENVNVALVVAVQIDRKDLIKYFLDTVGSDVNIGLTAAAKEGNWKLVNYFTSIAPLCR